MPISDEEMRRRTLVASGRYDELASLLQSVKLRKLLVSLSKAGVEDATLDSTGLATLNEFDISAKQPGERILLLEALRARLANRGGDGRKRGTVITACKGYCFVRPDGAPKKKGKDGYYCSFKDVEGRKTLVKGDRVAFEVVAVKGGRTPTSSRTSSSLRATTALMTADPGSCFRENVRRRAVNRDCATISGAWASRTSRPSSRASKLTRRFYRFSPSRT